MAARPSDVDRLSALPEALLQLVLSFLPSDEAVPTCVLSRHWRHLWRSTPALRVTDAEDKWEGREDMCECEFVNHLLLLRDPGAPLDVCEIVSSDRYDHDYEKRMRSFGYIKLWIRYALTHKARVLRVHTDSKRANFDLGNTTPLVSQHLTVLELEDVLLYQERDLDFSGCPALKTLKMEGCGIVASKISSQSLRHLIANGNTFDQGSRTRISAPALVSLQLNYLRGRTPALDSMPLLVTASVHLDWQCDDCCGKWSSGNCNDDSCADCSDCPDGSEACVLLRGLSNAISLELFAAPEVFIFRRDLVLCPKFSKLKTLLVNEWPLDVGLHSLVCILRNSPVLEKLTFQLSEVPEHLEEMEENQYPTEQRYAFEHLKVVEVKCPQVDDNRVQKLLKYLSFYGIHAAVKCL